MLTWNSCLSLGALVSCALPTCLEAQESRFRYDAAKVKVGVTYQYEKSNIDGSNLGNVALYVADKDRLESLKWHDGGSTATLVTAQIDWNRWSVRHFETWQLRAGSNPRRVVVAQYDAEQGRLDATAGDTKLSVQVHNRPWHSFDFDFASLNFAWRHLIDPQQSFNFGVTDVVRTANGPQLTDKGTVTVDYQHDAVREGHLCREYLINGPGLENRGGRIWIRKNDHIIVDYEIELPDEPGFTDAKLRLIRVEHMTPEQWREFKIRCVQ